MNESISRAAGSEWGQELPPEEMEALIRSAGRVAAAADDRLRRRPRRAGQALVRRRPAAAEPLNPPVREAGLEAPARLHRPAALAGSVARVGESGDDASRGEVGIGRAARVR